MCDTCSMCVGPIQIVLTLSTRQTNHSPFHCTAGGGQRRQSGGGRSARTVGASVGTGVLEVEEGRGRMCVYVGGRG